MPSPEQMKATMRRYLECVARSDLDGVLSLCADSISVEDPVGGGPGTHVVGRDEVAAFFGRGFERSRPRPTPTGPICTTASNEARQASSGTMLWTVVIYLSWKTLRVVFNHPTLAWL